MNIGVKAQAVRAAHDLGMLRILNKHGLVTRVEYRRVQDRAGKLAAELNENERRRWVYLGEKINRTSTEEKHQLRDELVRRYH